MAEIEDEVDGMVYDAPWCCKT